MNSPVIIGKIAYDAYSSERGWKSFNGDPLPQWDQVKPDIQVAWAAAAEASIEAFKASQLRELAVNFASVFNAMQYEVHTTAVEKGWWRDRHTLENVSKLTDVSRFVFATNQISCLALVVTEIAEAIEAIRNGNPPDDKIPAFNGAEAECADAVIRLMDLCESLGWDLAGAIVAKAEMNKGRSFKHGGKLA